MGVASGAVVLLVLLIVAFSGKSDGGGNLPVAVGGNTNGSPDAPASADDVAQKRDKLTDQVSKAADIDARMKILADWVPSVEVTPALKPDWERHFTRALEDAQTTLSRVDASDKDKARSFQKLAEWVERCNMVDMAVKVWKAVREYDEQNTTANERLGYVKYKLPEGEFWEAAMLEEDLLDELDPYLNKWVSPSELARLKGIEASVEQKVKDHNDWMADPFNAAAYQEQQRLKKLTTFANMEFDVVILKPWVVLITKEGNTARLFNQRREAYGQLLANLWREWKKNITKLGLKSVVPGDSLDNPRPFVAVGFATFESYDEYQSSQRRYLSPSTRAFYDPNNKTINFYESEDGGIGHYDDDMVLVHECSHQVMDRYSAYGCLGFQNHCLTEGYPEYLAYCSSFDERMQFSTLPVNSPKNWRGPNLRMLHTQINSNRRPYGDLQITDDDGLVFDVPMLMTLRDSQWTAWIGGAYIADQFANSVYYRRGQVREWLWNDPGDFFHVMFYAYAWAFTYWLNQYYPEQYQRWLTVAMGTDEQAGDAEGFCRAFGIRPVQTLPDLARYCGPMNKDLVRNQERAYAIWEERRDILRQTPGIQRIHREWAEWMNKTFPVERDLDNADLDREPVRPDAGAAFEALKANSARFIEAAENAMKDETGTDSLIFQLLLFRYMSMGITEEQINEVLAEGGLEVDWESGEIRKK